MTSYLNDDLRTAIMNRVFMQTHHTLHENFAPDIAPQLFRQSQVSEGIRNITGEVMHSVCENEDAVDEVLHEVCQRLHEFCESNGIACDINLLAAEAVASRLVCHGERIGHAAPSA